MTVSTATNIDFEIKWLHAQEADLVVDLFDQYRVFYKQPSDKKLAKQFIKTRLQHNESIIFVALAVNEDGTKRPVGFTQLYPMYSSRFAVKNWILNDFFVQEEYRKAGIGRSLLNTSIKFARDHGASIVKIETAVDNFKAQSLYEATGFEKQGASTEFLTYHINVRSYGK
ncbi:GNAT family N-acetyltransferase [Pedobacter sp. HMF7647]|uniref:GNAT family N-acetyltransferase n=1 Tax=Hufsiella arboris TaxID=2695275 RepID=A0A7K1Y6K0_9SPHI|nr:GNAT family N-acetyltransferase [Hufsiella arboris]MXV50041.1 GNAT family N-acetyltransferase [Hufsiella arboris]